MRRVLSDSTVPAEFSQADRASSSWLRGAVYELLIVVVSLVVVLRL